MPMPLRPRPLGVAAVCLALGLLGACSDNPEPRAVSSGSPTPDSSSDSTGGPPALPPEAKGTSKQAAVAFVRYAIEVLNYTARSLDTSALKDISSAECAACNGIRRTTGAIRSSGGRIEDGAWTPLETRPLAAGSPTHRQVQVLVRYAPQSVVKAKGKKP